MATQTIGKPIRVGIFGTVAAADRAVRDLLAAGYSKKELTVICSDKHKADLVSDGRKAEPPSTNMPAGMLAGGLIGASIGGLILAATALTTGGAVLVAAGTILIGGGAIAGTFTGALAARDIEPGIADYYDQAVQLGKILVAVEVHGEGAEARLTEAERILAETGAEPVAQANE